MTLAEQRAALVAILDNAIEEQWYPSMLLAAIYEAGFSIVGPEVTEKMREARHGLNYDGDKIFLAMAAAGDLARHAYGKFGNRP